MVSYDKHEKKFCNLEYLFTCATFVSSMGMNGKIQTDNFAIYRRHCKSDTLGSSKVTST